MNYPSKECIIKHRDFKCFKCCAYFFAYGELFSLLASKNIMGVYVGRYCDYDRNRNV